ncbi:relaxase domain-containing protein [Bradyrhizobium sp. ISRA442]|uniref:MobF family relaxase n=1 Tax=Bradyrhizobium sp. ISRA442 TaxID=2866197 RepID=UPI00311AE87A
MVATVAAGTSAEYYIASSDYYFGGSEPAGRWVAVGIDIGARAGSVVEREPFERLHAAIDADGRSMLSSKGGKKHVGGYDITFSAPKTCSILWALADDELRAKIEEAQAGAVEAALKAVEVNAAFCRSGKDGIHREKVKLTVAVFQHGDARPALHSDGQVFSDCALHSHAIVGNIARKVGQGTDYSVVGETSSTEPKRHGALDGKAIFAWKMAAGAVYHAQLSKNFQDLGFAVTDVGRNGIWEVAGITPRLKSYFSARRGEIEDELEVAGTDSASAPALAAAITKATRRAKQEQRQDRFAFWQQCSRDIGFDRNAVIESCLAAGREQQALLEKADRERVIQTRLAALPDQLTEHESTFERRHLYAAVATAFVGSGEGAERVEAEVDKLITTNAVVTLDRDVWGHGVFTTPEILRIESEIGEMAARLSRKSSSAPLPSTVNRLIGEHGLNEEQAGAVRAATSGARITILEGAPGAGKTTALMATTACWAHTDTNYRVIGASTAWKVSHALRDDLAIDARATDSWLVGAEHGVPFIDKNTVLIVDEAGLLSSRQMHRILSAVEAADAKGFDPHLILVGDRNQLQSVGAGPGLALAANASSVQSVARIVRQHEQWARDAVTAFGKGNAGEALEAFDRRGLLHETVGPKATVRAMVDAWATHEEIAPGRSLLIAKTNTQVRAISAEVRSQLRQQGKIRGEDVTLKAVTPSNLTVPLPLADGDRIRFLTRIKVGGIEAINGTEATVESIHAAGDERFDIAVRTDTGRFTFSSDEIADDEGRVKISHAYATTIYGAQGCTTDRAFVWLTPEMDRHSVLVASSRARNTTDLFCDRKSLDARIVAERSLSERSHASEIDPIARRAYLAGQLSRSGFKRSSLDILVDAQTRGAEQPRQETHRSPSELATTEVAGDRDYKHRKKHELDHEL